MKCNKLTAVLLILVLLLTFCSVTALADSADCASGQCVPIRDKGPKTTPNRPLPGALAFSVTDCYSCNVATIANIIKVNPALPPANVCAFVESLVKSAKVYGIDTRGVKNILGYLRGTTAVITAADLMALDGLQDAVSYAAIAAHDMDGAAVVTNSHPPVCVGSNCPPICP